MLVPKLRFKEFNNEYKKYKIGDTLKVKSGKDQKLIECINGKYPILGTGGQIGTTNNFLYDKPSVLIGRKGTINKPQYMTTPFWTVDTLFYTDIKKGFNTKYIFYAFQNINWKKYDESTGVPSLSCKTIEEILYYIPNKEEQDKISTFITLLDKKIELQQRKIDTLKIYKKGLIDKIYKEKLKMIKEVELKKYAYLQGGYAFKSELFSKKGIPIIRIANIVENRVNLKDIVFYDNKNSIDSKFEINIGDMLIAMSGANTGKIGIYKENIKSYLNQRVGKIVLKRKDINYSYLYFLFESSSYNIQLNSKLVAGAQPNISPSDIESLKFKIPSIELQVNIAEMVMNINKKIYIEENRIQELNKLKKGLLQKMFI